LALVEHAEFSGFKVSEPELSFKSETGASKDDPSPKLIDAFLSG